MQTVPASFEVGLTFNNAGGIDENTTETLIADGTDGTEPSGNGYARQTVASDGTDFPVAIDAGDYQAKTKTVTFTASGGPIPAAGTVDWMCPGHRGRRQAHRRGGAQYRPHDFRRRLPQHGHRDQGERVAGGFVWL